MRDSPPVAPAPDAELVLALGQALIHGDRETARVLLDQGADVNAPGHLGLSALFAAVNDAYVSGGKGTPLREQSDHRKELAELLLAHGAEVNAVNKGGETALMKAARSGCVESLAVLLEHGADLLAHDTRGQTALNVAKRFWQREAAEFLRSRKA